MLEKSDDTARGGVAGCLVTGPQQQEHVAVQLLVRYRTAIDGASGHPPQEAVGGVDPTPVGDLLAVLVQLHALAEPQLLVRLARQRCPNHTRARGSLIQYC